MKCLRFLFACLALFAIALPFETRAADRPNVILIFIDDMGWGDVGCYGNKFIDTPHIDQLAKDGVRFTDFYAAGATCSATRCALQSGQNQARIGITEFISGHWRPFERVIDPFVTMALPLQTVTVGEAMKAAGYTTGYVGKWHLGNPHREGPAKQGYDFAVEIGGALLPGKYRVINRKDLKPKPGQHRTEFEGDLTVKFIEENKDKPFFATVSPFAVHIPLAARSDKVAKYRKKAGPDHTLPHPVYAAMVEHVDDLVGRIVKAVEDDGLTERTMIVFTSDNGGLHRRYDYNPKVDPTVSDLAPLSGEKGTVYEGGIRVPLIVKYPPLVKAGTLCAEPTITYDFFPTFVELAKGKLPENQIIDGVSLLPLFSKPTANLGREAIHFHHPHYHHSRPATAIRMGRWKLIEFLDLTGDVELYDLQADIGEKKNLINERKGVASMLKKKMQDWRYEVGARMPIHNPSYDPTRAHEWWSRRNGKPVNSSARKPYPPTEIEAARK
jgi:uncharacterized sulfatase